MSYPVLHKWEFSGGNHLPLVDRSDPGLERVTSRVYIAVVRGTTVTARPKPYLQSCKSSWSGLSTTGRAGNGGFLRLHFDVSRTACTALVRQHRAKLEVSAASNGSPEYVCYSMNVVFTESYQDILADQFERQLVVAIFTPITNALLNFRGESFVCASLGLGQPQGRYFQFAGMLNLLSVGQGKQTVKAWVDPNLPFGNALNRAAFNLNPKTGVPAACAFNETELPDVPFRNPLFVEPNATKNQDSDPILVNLCPVRKGNGVQSITPSFQPRLTSKFPEASPPSGVSRVQRAAKSVGREAKLFTMTVKNVLKGFRRVVDPILPVLLNFADCPIPDRCKVKEPTFKLSLLARRQLEFDLTLDHKRILPL